MILSLIAILVAILVQLTISWYYKSEKVHDEFSYLEIPEVSMTSTTLPNDEKKENIETIEEIKVISNETIPILDTTNDQNTMSQEISNLPTIDTDSTPKKPRVRFMENIEFSPEQKENEPIQVNVKSKNFIDFVQSLMEGNDDDDDDDDDDESFNEPSENEIHTSNTIEENVTSTLDALPPDLSEPLPLLPPPPSQALQKIKHNSNKPPITSVQLKSQREELPPMTDEEMEPVVFENAKIEKLEKKRDNSLLTRPNSLPTPLKNARVTFSPQNSESSEPSIQSSQQQQPPPPQPSSRSIVPFHFEGNEKPTNKKQRQYNKKNSKAFYYKGTLMKRPFQQQ